MTTIPVHYFSVSLCLLLIIFGVTMSQQASAQSENVLTGSMKSLSSQDVNLDEFKGKVVLIVNVASKCGLTSQYTQLEQLHDKYSDQGLVVAGFPCNQFAGQEPGTAEEIQKFCSSKYNVSFPLFAKVEVNGDGACELYKRLTRLETEPVGPGPISWNFEKFLVGRNGQVIARFGPRTRPDASEVVNVIERELAK